ncbi:MAG: hypothetical protein LQ340_007185 [Diploschistes diacapsis]|nr:MAG: hypothetical protein LQ340_007185 [Diploschistes diacapsis]
MSDNSKNVGKIDMARKTRSNFRDVPSTATDPSPPLINIVDAMVAQPPQAGSVVGPIDKAFDSTTAVPAADPTKTAETLQTAQTFQIQSTASNLIPSGKGSNAATTSQSGDPSRTTSNLDSASKALDTFTAAQSAGQAQTSSSNMTFKVPAKVEIAPGAITPVESATPVVAAGPSISAEPNDHHEPPADEETGNKKCPKRIPVSMEQKSETEAEKTMPKKGGNPGARATKAPKKVAAAKTAPIGKVTEKKSEVKEEKEESAAKRQLKKRPVQLKPSNKVPKTKISRQDADLLNNNDIQIEDEAPRLRRKASSKGIIGAITQEELEMLGDGADSPLTNIGDETMLRYEVEANYEGLQSPSKSKAARNVGNIVMSRHDARLKETEMRAEAEKIENNNERIRKRVQFDDPHHKEQPKSKQARRTVAETTQKRKREKEEEEGEGEGEGGEGGEGGCARRVASGYR